MDLVYKICQKIIFARNNENDCDMQNNGEYHLLNKLKNKLKTVFDVGANVGEWTNYIYNLKTDCQIYSFEPSKKTYAELQNNTNNQIKIFNIGFGIKKENVIFYNYDSSTLNSIYKRDNVSKKITEEMVQIDTIDNFCIKNNINEISFLKIDVEGNELSVIKGANQMISSGKIKYIQFEYGGTYIDAKILLKDIFEFFKNKPYSIYKILQNDLKKYSDWNQSLENFQYSNYIAILNQEDNQ